MTFAVSPKVAKVATVTLAALSGGRSPILLLRALFTGDHSLLPDLETLLQKKGNSGAVGGGGTEAACAHYDPVCCVRRTFE